MFFVYRLNFSQLVWHGMWYSFQAFSFAIRMCIKRGTIFCYFLSVRVIIYSRWTAFVSLRVCERVFVERVNCIGVFAVWYCLWTNPVVDFDLCFKRYVAPLFWNSAGYECQWECCWKIVINNNQISAQGNLEDSLMEGNELMSMMSHAVAGEFRSIFVRLR